MKRFSLGIAALLCSTAPANADPVVAFLGGFLNALGAGTFLAAGGSVAAWTAGFQLATFFSATMVGRLLVAGGIAAYQSAQARREANKQADASINAIQINKAQPVSFMERGYGYVKTGGYLGYTGFSQNRRWNVIILAAQRTQGPIAHYLDALQVGVDGAGNVTTAPIQGYGSIRTYTGGQQAADARLEAAFDDITAGFDFAGMSYAVVECIKPPSDLFQTIYTEGKDWVYAPVWAMDNQIFDPRDGQRKFTRNAALVIANEAVFFGKEVDWADVAVEADICDQLVSDRDGNLQPRWTIDALISDDMTWEDVRAIFATACDAWFYERPDGKVGFKVGRYIAPTITLTDADFLSIDVSEAAWGPDEYGEFSVRYVDHASGHVENESAPMVFDAAAPRMTNDCKAISTHNQACRVAKRMGTKTRARYKFNGTVKLIGYEVIGQRFIRIAHSGLGFDQIVEIEKLPRDEGGLTFSLSAFSVEENDFTFNAAIEELAKNIQDDAAPDAFELPPAPNFISASESLYVTRDGNGVKARVNISWSQPDGFENRYILQGSLNGGGFVTLAETSETSAIIEDIAVGNWIFRVAARSILGRTSAWSPTLAQAVLGLAAPPAALENVSGSSLGGLILLRWDPVQDLDVIYGGSVLIRHSSSNTPAWENSTSVGTVPGRATNVAAELMEGTYLLRARDSMGVLGPVSVVYSPGLQAVPYVTTGTLQEDDEFSGAKSGTAALGGILMLDTDSDIWAWDDIWAVPDIWTSGNVVTTGTYNFATGFNFGAVKTVRLQRIVEFSSLALSTDIWAWDDIWAVPDIWGAAEGADVVVEISTTQTDPSVSPVWSGRQRLGAAEITAWGVKARAILSTERASVSPAVAKLRVIAQEVS